MVERIIDQNLEIEEYPVASYGETDRSFIKAHRIAEQLKDVDGLTSHISLQSNTSNAELQKVELEK